MKMKFSCSTKAVYSVLFILAVKLNFPSVECSGNVTEVQEEASVEEIPNPTMTIERADVTDYRPPGYYPFNNGEPFFMEKDPVTGVVDFNKKTNAVTSGYSSKSVEFTSASKQDRVLDEERANNNTDSDYYEDEEVAIEPQDFKEDEIDRKDGNLEGDVNFRPNDLFKNNPYKISPDLHQFLNLPVHYSSSDKFPLISSSYANTKIQGTGGNSNSSNGYSNHKYHQVTSSTQSPSYYTMWHTSSTTTPKTTTLKEVMTTASTTYSTTTPTTTTKVSSTSYKSPYAEYPDGEDLAYSDYDLEYDQQNSFTQTPITTSTVSYSKYPSTYQSKITTTKSTTSKNYEEETEDNVSIVTSLPIDEYFYLKDLDSSSSSSTSSSSTPSSTTTTTTSTTTQKTTTEKQKETTLPPRTTQPIKSTFSPTRHSSTSKPTTLFTKPTDKPTPIEPISSTKEEYRPLQNNVYNSFYGSKESFSPMTEEPFRPIFGPIDSSSSSQVPVKQHLNTEIKSTTMKPYFEYHAPSQAKPMPSGNQGKIEFVDRTPQDEQISPSLKKPLHTLPLQEPSRPHSSFVYSKYPQENFNKQTFSNQNADQIQISSENTNIKPLHETTHYGRPQTAESIHTVSKIPQSEAPIRPPPQKQRPPFIRLPDDSQSQFQLKKHSNVSIIKIPRPEVPMQPHQRPMSSGMSVSLNKPPPQQPVKFHPPLKQDNHYVKIPMNQENPSYSLQTSFSIGSPSEHPGENNKLLARPGPGVGIGQILFPDDTIDQSLSVSEGNKKDQPTIVKGRPQNPRPYITTTYSQNINPQSQPSPILPQRPQRVPIPDLRVPKPEGDVYPRPHWENHGKPPIVFNSPPPHNKQEIPVSSFSTVNRIKQEPPHAQRHDLPNILPQFRPNAKVGGSEYPLNIGIQNERLREPMDTLQPPPLPQPQHLRANRNDDDIGFLLNEELEKSFKENNATKSTFYSRNGQQATSRVTTLQMMLQSPSRKTLLRSDYHDHRKDRPVFLVYPSNAGHKPNHANEGVVVVGAQGPQKPLPPSNLDKGEEGEIREEDADLFPLDDNKHFPIGSRDRVDTPILKTKTPNKPAMKNEFPYAILKPEENILPEERILTNSAVTKEYNAFSPTISSSTEDIKDHDSEINIIPYLQDYMPFATKKPTTVRPLVNVPPQILIGERVTENRKPLSSTIRPISVTLNTKIGSSTTFRPGPSKPVEQSKPSNPTILSAPSHHQVSITSGDSEFTVGAMMNYQKNTINHRPIEIQTQTSSIQPKPIDLEPPFQASLSAPQSQGWTVIKKTDPENKAEVERFDQETDSTSENKSTEEKFDFDNFKPQLFGGFKPIIPQESSDGMKMSSKEDGRSEQK